MEKIDINNGSSEGPFCNNARSKINKIQSTAEQHSNIIYLDA